MDRDNLTSYMAYIAYQNIINIHSYEKIVSQFMVIFLINPRNWIFCVVLELLVHIKIEQNS
jgi:hypothetical protein